MNDRRSSNYRISHTELIINNTRLVRAGSWVQDALIAMGWRTLSVEGDNALMCQEAE